MTMETLKRASIGGRRGSASSETSSRLRTVAALVLFVVVLGVVPYGMDAYTMFLFTQILVYAAAAVSLQMLWGRGGQLSFGHAAFFGIGAFGYAIAATRYELPGLLALLIALVLPGLVGLIIGYFLFFGGVRGAYFSVVTLAFVIVVNQLAISWSSLTGGDSGMTGVPGLNVESLGIDLSSRAGKYYLALAVLAITLAVALVVRFSKFGLVLEAIRENERRVTFCGFNTSAYLTILLVLSAALAGLAGGAFAAVSNYAAPDMLGTLLSIEMLTWVAIGGRNYIAGALVGVFALRWLNVEVSTFLPTSWPLVVGLFFVAVVLFFPRGIVGSLASLRTAWSTRGGPSSPDGTE
jgi:urea ABC transporter permease protein UrtC